MGPEMTQPLPTLEVLQAGGRMTGQRRSEEWQGEAFPRRLGFRRGDGEGGTLNRSAPNKILEGEKL